jgi:N,N'-diacetyllegionaminate synthase
MEIIAELGSVHDGSFGNAIKLIELAAKVGATVAKFQLHISEEESTLDAPSPSFFKEENRYEYFNRLSFTDSQWREIVSVCHSHSIKFGCSVFSIKALDQILSYNIDVLKIPSGEVSNIPLINMIAECDVPVHLSTGMSTWSEIDEAVEILARKNLSIFQCTSLYPTNPSQVGLNVISEMQTRYGFPIGFSDHTQGFEFSVAAVSLGASLIEKHLTFSRQMYGSDAFNALEPSEFEAMCKGLRNIELAMLNPIDKNHLVNLIEVRKTFQKSIYASRFIPTGEVITVDSVKFLKPDVGISARHWKTVVGKKSRRDINSGEVILKEDVE